jgi:hypothetical protein
MHAKAGFAVDLPFDITECRRQPVVGRSAFAAAVGIGTRAAIILTRLKFLEPPEIELPEEGLDSAANLHRIMNCIKSAVVRLAQRISMPFYESGCQAGAIDDR